MKRISIQLDDGAALSALTVGEGRPLIMIPGWSQTSAEWEGTVESPALFAGYSARHARPW